MHKSLISRYARFTNIWKNSSTNPLKFLKNKFIFSLLTGSVITHGIKQTMESPRYCQTLPDTNENSNKIIFPDEFTDEKYEQALKDKYNVVILWDPDRYVEKFQTELLDFIASLEYFQNQSKGRKVKLLTFRPKSGEDIKKFQAKYNIELQDDTLLLLKSKYFRGFYQFDAEHYFQKPDFIFRYFRRMQKINQKQQNDFTASLDQLNSDSKIIACYIPRSSPNFKSMRNRFAILTLENSLAENKNLHYVIISDEETAKKFNLKPEKEGEIFLFSKSNKYNHFNKTVTLGEKHFTLLPTQSTISNQLDEILINMSKVYKDNFVFTSQSFDHVPTRYSLVLEVDQNRISKPEFNRCIEAFSHLHAELKAKEPNLFNEIGLVRINRKRNGSVYTVFLRDDKMTMEELNKSQLKDAYQKVNLEEEDVKPHTYIYEFPEDSLLNKQNLLSFIKNVKENKVPEKFKSQVKPKYQRYSKKIVGETFNDEVLNSNKDQVMFFYSKHCHACKQYGGYYEQFALENLRKGSSNVEFNRMNSDMNALSDFPNFHYTPIFMVIRKEAKKNPLIYKSQHFTPTLLQNFIEVSLSNTLLSKNEETKMLKNIKQGKDLMKDWKISEAKFNH